MLYCFRFHSLSVEPCACFLCVSLVECCWEITGRGGKDIYRHLNVALRHMWSTYAAHYCFYSVTQSSSLPSVSLSLFPGYFTSLYDNWGDYDGWMWDDMSSCVNSQVDWNQIVFQILTAYHQIRNKSVVKYKTKMFHFSLFFCFASMGPIPIFILSILLLFLLLLLLPLVLLTLPRVSTVSETKIFASSHNHSPPSLFKTLLYLLLKGFPSELQSSLSSLPSHLLLLPVSPSPQPLRPWTVMPGVFKKEAEDFPQSFNLGLLQSSTTWTHTRLPNQGL